MRKYSVVILLVWAFVVSCSSSANKAEVDEFASYEDSLAKAEYTGPFVEYYEDGKKKIVGQLKKGLREGHWLFYYPNGFVWSDGYYKAGQRHGRALVFFDNGKKRIDGQYNNGLETGWWYFNNEQGDLIKKVNFDVNPPEEVDIAPDTLNQ